MKTHSWSDTEITNVWTKWKKADQHSLTAKMRTHQKQRNESKAKTLYRHRFYFIENNWIIVEFQHKNYHFGVDCLIDIVFFLWRLVLFFVCACVKHKPRCTNTQLQIIEILTCISWTEYLFSSASAISIWSIRRNFERFEWNADSLIRCACFLFYWSAWFEFQFQLNRCDFLEFFQIEK